MAYELLSMDQAFVGLLWTTALDGYRAMRMYFQPLIDQQREYYKAKVGELEKRLNEKDL